MAGTEEQEPLRAAGLRRAANLGLKGDGDDVDLIVALEKAFGVRFSDEATSGWRNVGDMFDGLLRVMPPGQEAGRCASAMAFYRLRRALSDGAPHGRLSPSTRLADLIPGSPRRFRERLGRETGLAMPLYELTAPGKAGLYLLALAALWLVAGPLVGLDRWLAVLPGLAGALLIYLDPCALAQETLGELAEDVAARNFAHLLSEGADARPQALWQAFAHVVRAETGTDLREITRETLLLAGQGRG